MKSVFSLGVSGLLLLSACTDNPNTGVEPEIDTTSSPDDAPETQTAGIPAPAVTPAPAAEASFPLALRGKWREAEGPAPTAAQCDGNANPNMGKVMEVGDTRFSIFENGGTIIEVRSRHDGELRAVFDTTYADTPTSADLTFAVDPVARTLTVKDNGPGSHPAIIYKRCPS